MYSIGYIVNDKNPFFETIELSEVNQYKGSKPILIVGVEKALEYCPTLDLSYPTIEGSVSYIFSYEESDEYRNQLDNYISKLLLETTSSYIVKEVSYNPENIKIESEYSFLYETATIITLTTGNTIYYINKEIYYFFNSIPLETYLDKLNHKVLSWHNHIFFGAFLKSFNQYTSLDSFKAIFKNYGDVDLHLGAVCLTWFLSLDLPSIDYGALSLWNRAYDIETRLSSLKVKVNVKKLEKSQDDNDFLQSIYSSVQDGYVIQKYNGTDKTTGRMYVKDSSFSLQTLPEKLRDIIIAEKGCILLELDYDYFEYFLLSQFCDIPLTEDPHLNMSRLVWNDDHHRSQGKAINYSVIYGQSIKKTVEKLDVDNKDEITEKLEEVLLPIREFEDKLKLEYKRNGFVLNHFGRAIYPEKEYALLNNYIQSTAADYFIIKLEKLFELLPQYDGDNKIVLQNHDSVLLNLDLQTIENTSVVETITELLESPERNIYGKVSFNYGYDWKNLE